MKLSTLEEPERRVWQAAATGELVPFQVGDREHDPPEKGAEWGAERTVRAEVITALLIGDGEAASVAVRGVRLRGARITGELKLEAATLRCRLALVDCYFDSAITLDEATAVSVRLSGSHVPTVHARQLVTRGDLRLDKGFSVSGGVDLAGAHIGGVFDCTKGKFFNAIGPALTAYRLTVDQDMVCSEGFEATGEVGLSGAHIGGKFDCRGGKFSNRKPDGNPDSPALTAYRLSVDAYMFCGEGFEATGEVRLSGAHIGGRFDCTKGKFSNAIGPALTAYRLTVDQDMFCRQGFEATGEVRLSGAHIGGMFDCTKGKFFNAKGPALNLLRATVSDQLRMDSAVLEGILDLTGAKTSIYYDDRASWPQKLRLDGFVYDAITDNSPEDASAKKPDLVKERLEWLRRNESGYSPQIYDQLAAVYRRAGHDDAARRVLIAKQRRRFAQRNPAWRVGGYVLDGLVGYGYRTWLAAFWLAGFLIFGTWLFGSVYRGDLTPASKTNVPPPFQPFLYTLDLLLPVVSLHVRDAWIAHGAAQWWSVAFIIVGWILATAVVLSLTGLLKRD